MELSNKQREQLQKALISAFPSPGDLKQMVDFGLNENLDSIATGSKHTEIVFSLIKWAQSQGRLADLIKAARETNPGNEQLRAFDERLQQQRVIKLRNIKSGSRTPSIAKNQLEGSIEDRQLPRSTKVKDTSEQPKKKKRTLVNSSLLEKFQLDFLKPAYRYHNKLKRSQKLLKQVHSLFSNQEDIYSDLCDRAIKIIEDLSKLVLKFRDDTDILSYQIKVEMNHIIVQASHLASDLRTFRGECPRPPSTAYTKRLQYDHNRQEIYRKLDTLLSTLNYLDDLLKDFFTRSVNDAKETH